jgi:putative nucleotidyltransferase with HDIG domain
LLPTTSLEMLVDVRYLTPFPPEEMELLREVRDRHLTRAGLRERLCGADPASGRQAYLQEQMDLVERLSAGMSVAIDPDQLARDVVVQVQETLGVFGVMIAHVLPDPGVVRTVASAGPARDAFGRYLIAEFPLHRGVVGRVARTGVAALIEDTALEPEFLSRDSETDPRSELVVPIRVDAAVWGVLVLVDLEPDAFEDSDATVMGMVANQLGVALHRIDMYGELERALVTTLTVIGAAMEVRDAYTALHEEAVAQLAAAIAAELGLDPGEQRTIRYAALTHDIGKLSVPNEILHKPGPLDVDEWAIMRRHTIVGAEMLGRIPFFEGMVAPVRGHHERWDGRGYPDGLCRGEIPIGARILCVCDSYNAMTTSRPYREAMSERRALEELRRCAGSQFDPRVVAAMERVLERRMALV